LEEKEETDVRSKSQWFIDLDWYQQNQRSFTTATRCSLCPDCLRRLEAKGSEVSADELLSAIKGCCSTMSEYITPRLALMESVFRIILANGNHPLGLEELGRQLNERRGGGAYHASEEMLLRLLESDCYYGLCRAEG